MRLHDPFSCHCELPDYKCLFFGKNNTQNDSLIPFIKQHLIADLFDFSPLDYNILKLSFHYNNVPFIILCMYRSPSSDYISFVKSLRSVLNNLNLNKCVITLIGDININIIGAQTNNIMII